MVTEQDAARLTFSELENLAYSTPDGTQISVKVLRIILHRVERVIGFEVIRYAEKTSTTRKR